MSWSQVAQARLGTGLLMLILMMVAWSPTGTNIGEIPLNRLRPLKGIR